MISPSAENPINSNDLKEQLKKRKIGIAFGSGGVYAAAGVGALEVLENEGIHISFIAGASGGALIAALHYLEGDINNTKQVLMSKLPIFSDFKLDILKPPVPGIEIKTMISNFLDGRDWNDGKLQGACFGAGYVDTHENILLTKESGLSLVDCVLASTSLGAITPVVELNGRKIAHGGDPYYINGLKQLGADYIIEVSPNVETGIVGKVARTANAITAVLIGNKEKDRIAAVRSSVDEEGIKTDMAIHPDLSLRPFVWPFTFNVENVEYMMAVGKRLTNKSLGNG